MRTLISILAICVTLLCGSNIFAQDLRFNQVLKGRANGIQVVKQDKHGVLWIASFDSKLQRYDGVNLKSYVNDPNNPLSKAGAPCISLFVDADNIIWVGTFGKGLERLDPATNTFTHFIHNAQDAYSLSNDTVTMMYEDRSGNFWVASLGGLDLLDRKTGKFTHYKYNPANPEGLSHSNVFGIMEDRMGVLWLSVGSFDASKGGIWEGALNRFDKSKGRVTRYHLDSAKSANKLPGKFISDMYEDKKGNFWISTDEGLATMDRNSGKITRYYPDPFHSGTLGKVPVKGNIATGVNFVMEDATGAFWVSMAGAGLNRYDPVSKKSTHYGAISDRNGMLVSAADTTSGVTDGFIQGAMNSMDGLFWVYGRNKLLQLNYNKTILPFHNISQNGANALHLDAKSKLLWIATSEGLVRKDLNTLSEKKWVHSPKHKNSVSANAIGTIEADKNGNLWLGSFGGVDKFDPVTERFTNYRYVPGNPTSISANNVFNLFFDHNNNLWAATDSGISKMDPNTGQFTNYNFGRKDTTLFKPGQFACVTEDAEHFIWTSSNRGVFRLNAQTGKYQQYITNAFIKSICVDSKGVVWAGGLGGLYVFNKAKNDFDLFADEESAVSISSVINIMEDDQMNLWVSTSSAIIKINADRVKIKKYAEANGVRPTGFWYNDNFKAEDGQLFLGIENGYYAFYPASVSDSTIAPLLTITGFKLNDKVEEARAGGILKAPLWQTDEIRLSYDQNVFSFDFFAVDYISTGDMKYFFMLENYDNNWHDLGGDHRASFYNIPPGNYVFRVKAVSNDGGFAEKSIRIIITPPWYKTWWAYLLYAILTFIIGYLVFLYQKYYILSKERERTQQKELAQAKEIEKAYHELKNTQTQLIQSEKMASLGELTAGIAHEIQNPLNFVNNFAGVSTELAKELVEEAGKGNLEEVKAIANDLESNLQKIYHHGGRAAAIVKGMLQHSRTSSGSKEPTDINALCEEYLRLAYHGIRAKNNAFNAKWEMDFDEDLGKVNVVPQDMGRVLLNLINNAFYAVSEKAKQYQAGYEPIVTVSTKWETGKVIITLADNGNGIPAAIKEKIFQPFFTTKPTGQGTGLGLSLSYDIITKGHGGELTVQSEEGKGAAFTIQLPAK